MTPPTATLGVDLRILATRSQQRIAPDGVMFRAEASGLEAEPAASRNGYDPSFHDIHYEWDFGDLHATTSRLSNLPAAHADLNRGFGKEVGHVYRQPGQYIVRCVARDLRGQVGVAEISVAVADPTEIFIGHRTILIDPEGVGDPENYPNATIVSDWTSAVRARQGIYGLSRILFRRGTAHTFEDVAFGDEGPVLALGAWGEGAPPRISAGRSNRALLRIASRFGGDVTLSGLDFQGPWDSTTESGGPHINALRQESQALGHTTVIDDCHFAGFGVTLRTTSNRDGLRSHTFLNASAITDWGDMGVFMPNNSDASMAITGSTICQHPRAMMGGSKGGGYNAHGPMRTAWHRMLYIAASEMFSRNGWSGAGGLPADQPCLRFNSGANPGASGILDRVVMEGGFTILALAKATRRGPRHPVNFVADKCLFLGTARTITSVGSQYGGTTIRNSVVIQPNVPMLTNSYRSAFSFALTEEQVAPDAPVRVYNCTIINLMNDTHADGSSLDAVRGIEEFEVFGFENNLVHRPALSEENRDEIPDDALRPFPLETVAGRFRPRYLGARYRASVSSRENAQITMDERFATPSDSVVLYVPADPSNRDLQAVGWAALDDFLLHERPGEDGIPVIGAIET